MQKYFSKIDRQNIAMPIGEAFKRKINKIYKDKKIGLEHLKGRAEIEPDLDGFWGFDRHSMNSQCCKMGIPSIQLEIPPDFRKNMADSDKMIEEWAQAIIEIYHEVVVPTWVNKTTSLTMNPRLAKLYTDQNLNNNEIEMLSKEHQKVDRWATSDFKMSKHVF